MTHSIDYLGISININILYYMYWILSLKGEVRWEGMRVHGLALSLSPTACPVMRGAPPCMPSTSGSWQASSRKGYRQLNLASLPPSLALPGNGAGAAALALGSLA